MVDVMDDTSDWTNGRRRLRTKRNGDESYFAAVSHNGLEKLD